MAKLKFAYLRCMSKFYCIFFLNILTDNPFLGGGQAVAAGRDGAEGDGGGPGHRDYQRCVIVRHPVIDSVE